METKKTNEDLVRYIQEVNKTFKSILSESKGRQLELEEMQSNLKPTGDFISAFQLLDETEKSNYKRKDELMKGKVLVNRYKTHTKIITKLAERRKRNLTVISGALSSCVTLEEEEVEFLNSLNEEGYSICFTCNSYFPMVEMIVRGEIHPRTKFTLANCH
ncbi:uncharacterized protein LOC135216865 isoform X1 [Macrobrachium nipponense]|uniref:uncharacterized protein LOC135216865 isoform X1 n=1 Tax=Macrobrachium nipponense TaxID=159736 RepID=UPI0030C860CB